MIIYDINQVGKPTARHSPGDVNLSGLSPPDINSSIEKMIMMSIKRYKYKTDISRYG
jgi:hypothetical protein